MADETTVALNRRARHDFTIDETFEAGIVLTGTEIKSLRAGKANLTAVVCARRARRGLAGGRPHRAVRGRAIATTTSRSGRGSCCSTDPRSTSCSAAPRPRARPSCRSGCTSTSGAGPRSSSRWRAASSSTIAGGTSPTATPGATSRASWPTRSEGARRMTAIPDRLRLGPVVSAVDAHAAGEPGRVIVGGVEDVPGATMFDKMAWLQAHRDDLRLRMLREPRGYPAANCNLLLPPTRPRRRCRLRDHGAGRVPGDVGHEHDVRGDRAARDRHPADDRAGHRARRWRRRPG